MYSVPMDCRWLRVGLIGWLLMDQIFLIMSQVEPSVEFRSLFIATVDNIDWPSRPGDSSMTQRSEMISYLDHMTSLNMNALVFQIRTTGDAFYPSSIEPWSKYLTGTQGLAPDPLWDPLQVMIEEAHRRNIEVHVWLNPYRANMQPNWDGLAPNHMANVLRQYAYPYSSYLWMDPGAEPVIQHLINVTQDIVSRYEVDGVHMDDYFYPYPDGTAFPDDATYDSYLMSGGSMALGDWRRNNVNTMITRMLQVVKTVRPGCKFSISPFGLYRPGEPGGMPPPITGFDPYSQIYADAKLWLQMGWVDFLAPQIYWAINSTGQSYPLVLDWWLANNPARKYIYAAMAVYKIMPDSSNWSVQEIVDQINVSRDPVRRSQLSQGNIMFSAKYFRDNNKNISNIFSESVYTMPSTTPPIGGRSERKIRIN